MRNLSMSLAACALLAPNIWSVGHAAGDPLPIEHFTRFAEYGAMKVSPDGKFMAVGTGRFGGELLMFIDLDKKASVFGVKAREGFEVAGFDWISDTRVVYYPAMRWPGNNFATPTGEFTAIDRDGKRQAVIYGARFANRLETAYVRQQPSSLASATVVSMLRNDASSILITEQPWREGRRFYYENRDAIPTITRLNVFNGRKNRVDTATLASARILVDHNDQVRFASGYNRQSRFTVAWKPKPGAPWEEFELPGFRDQSVVPQAIAADERAVLFTGVREGESLDALFRLDLETHEVEKLFGHAEVDIDRLVRSADHLSIVGVRVYTDKPEYHWLVPDDPVAVTIQALQRAFPDKSVSVTSLSRDGRRGIAFVSSDVDPGHYFTIDTETMRAEHFAAIRGWIDPARMRSKEPIALSARDGLPLRGYITRPAGEGPHPLVVIPHGGPHQVRDDWAFDPEVQLLASRGYAVLQVNFRGSSGYGMDFEAAGYREWGGRIQDDIADATRWTVEKGIAEEGRICIFGSSFGGYSALMSAMREPRLYQCVVAFAGVYDLELMFSSGDIPRSRLGLTYLEEVLGRNISLLRENSPVSHAERLEAPVLLIHGRDDWRADVSHARSMKAALENAQKPHEWVELRREGHGIYDEDLRKETYERILAFLGQHLGR
jgi:dienelactone hydrolase